MIPIITLKKGKEASLFRKHPWVFSGAIATNCERLEDGQLVSVHRWNGDFLAIGHFQHGSISIRIISFNEVPINQEFWNVRISTMIELRKKLGLLSETNSILRICHGEGDEVPGLVIDYYTGVAVIQCHSIGMIQHLDEITKALALGLGDDLKAVYHKSSDTLPKRHAITDGYLYGEAPTPHYAIEDGITYAIDWINGQKTGFFIDQRENRALLAKYAKGKSVLNTFCYSGGFSLYALEAGAASVISLDASAKAIDLVNANIALNKMQDLQHEAIVGETLPYLKANEDEFDIIVLDPPAFAKSMNAKHKALQGYQKINELALRKIKKNGLFSLTSSKQKHDAKGLGAFLIAPQFKSRAKTEGTFQIFHL